MEARPRDLHPEPWEGPGAAPVLSTQKSVSHDLQPVWKDRIHYDTKRSRWAQA